MSSVGNCTPTLTPKEPKHPDTALGIRVFGLATDLHTLAYVRQRIDFKLGKFGPYIKGCEIHMKPGGGAASEPRIACSLSIVLAEGDPLVVERSAIQAGEAFDHAIGVAERSVRQTFQRSRHH